jgi:hypothetical protein
MNFFAVFVPDLKQLVSGAMTIDQKYEILAFLIGNLIDVDNLKMIPIKYLTHVIILVHLTAEESLKVFEAVAFTEALKDVNEGKIPRIMVYPIRVDVRALRTSFLYSTIYYVFTRCLSSVGLHNFVVSSS